MYIQTMESYSALNRKEILTYATTWIPFEDIRVSEISQFQKDKYLLPLHLCEVPSTVKFTERESKMEGFKD